MKLEFIDNRDGNMLHAVFIAAAVTGRIDVQEVGRQIYRAADENWR